jgi:hypothetical protein
MKQAFKIMALLLMILLYGFMIVPYNGGNPAPDPNPEQDPVHSPANERSYFNAAILFHAISSENQLSGAGSVPAPSLKNHVNDYVAHHQMVEMLIFNYASDYLLYSLNIDPGFPKTVITFPFHYFW